MSSRQLPTCPRCGCAPRVHWHGRLYHLACCDLETEPARTLWRSRHRWQRLASGPLGRVWVRRVDRPGDAR